jgi:hypothetical protein
VEYLGIKRGDPWCWVVLYRTAAGVQMTSVVDRAAADRVAVSLHGVVVPMVPQGTPPAEVPRQPF